MALSPEEKQRIFEILAAGGSDTEAAKTVGCDRTTVYRLRKKAESSPLLQQARNDATAKEIRRQGDRVVDALEMLKEREPQIQESLWKMFEGLSGLFAKTLEQTDPADVSPRQLPTLARAAAELATAYAGYADRVNGLEVLADEIQQINETRAA